MAMLQKSDDGTYRDSASVELPGVICRNYRSVAVLDTATDDRLNFSLAEHT